MGPKRRNPKTTTSTITAKRKGDPQHYIEGKIVMIWTPAKTMKERLQMIQEQEATKRPPTEGPKGIRVIKMSFGAFWHIDCNRTSS